MPIDLSKVPERLINAVKFGNVIPFVGSGLSRQAKTSDPNAFPSWSKLLLDLGEYGVREGYLPKKDKKEIDGLTQKGKYLMAAQALKSALPPDELDQILQERFLSPDSEPGQIHGSIFKLNPPLIITTNYDRLLEDAYSKLFGKAPVVTTFKDAPTVQRYLQSYQPKFDRTLIFKIHGTAERPTEAVLGEMDYRNLLYREPGYRNVLSAIFVTKVVLMLGFSFADPELRALLESLRDSLKYGSSPDYIVLEKGKKGDVEKRLQREHFGLQAIEYTASPGHPEILELVQHLGGFASTTVP